jgi:hypothetical protein
MSEVTPILHATAEGDPHSASQFLPLVYQDLCDLAAVQYRLMIEGPEPPRG